VENHGEKIIDCGQREAFERLTITGIPEKGQPLPKQQAMRLIDRLDSIMPTFQGYKMYLVKGQTSEYTGGCNPAIYTLFEASWTANSVSSPPTKPTINIFGAQGPRGDKWPKGCKTQGIGKGGGKTPGGKDEKDGTDKLGDKTKRPVSIVSSTAIAKRTAGATPRQRPNRPTIRGILKYHSSKARQTNISRFTQHLAFDRQM
jgi:hypothetical protein